VLSYLFKGVKQKQKNGFPTIEEAVFQGTSANP